MKFSNIINDLSSAIDQGRKSNPAASSSDRLQSITSNLPGGLAGGAIAGGMVALLASNKSARKFAGNAAKYGGTALLGGLAYKAYQGWQSSSSSGQSSLQGQRRIDDYEQEAQAHIDGREISQRFEVALIKSMICAARADDYIDSDERRKISEALQKMNVDHQVKGEVLDLFLTPFSIDDFVGDLESLEQKAEVYLASCLVIDLDHEAEYAHLSNLSSALKLPEELTHQLRLQANQALQASA